MQFKPENPQGSKLRVLIRWKTEPVLKDYSDNPDVIDDFSDYVFNLPRSGKDMSDDEAYLIFIGHEDLLGLGIYYISTEIVGNAQGVVFFNMSFFERLYLLK